MRCGVKSSLAAVISETCSERSGWCVMRSKWQKSRMLQHPVTDRISDCSANHLGICTSHIWYHQISQPRSRAIYRWIWIFEVNLHDLLNNFAFQERQPLISTLMRICQDRNTSKSVRSSTSNCVARTPIARTIESRVPPTNITQRGHARSYGACDSRRN